MASSPTLLSVSKQFVHSFYKILHQSPQELHRFYKESSSFTYGSEATYGTSDETVSGLEGITKKIQQLEFQNCRVTLSVVDAQSSIQGGIIIMVVGHLSNREESPRKFVQTFYLAEQSNATSRGYYVQNDIFRYLDEPQEESEGQEGEQQKEFAPSEPSPPPEVNKESRPAVSEETPVSKVQKEAPQQSEPSPKPTPVATGANIQDREESAKPPAPVKKVTPPAPIEDNKPISWAGVISKAQPQAEPSTAPAIVNKSTVSQKATAAPARKEAERPAGNASLFVSNVPFSATEEQVRAIFVQFGEVKSVSVNTNKGLAFIDMATADIALKAIDSGRNGELVLEGRTLSVVEKKPQKQGGSFRGDKDQRGPRIDKKDQRGDKGDRVDRGERINGKTSAPREQRRQ
jgi:RNA recognition motif-containing protein